MRLASGNRNRDGDITLLRLFRLPCTITFGKGSSHVVEYAMMCNITGLQLEEAIRLLMVSQIKFLK